MEKTSDEVKMEHKEMDRSGHTRVSFSSQSGCSFALDKSFERSIVPRKFTTTTLGSNLSTSEWQPPRYRRLWVGQTSVKTYNIGQCLRRVFSMCWNNSFEKSADVVILGRLYYGSDVSHFYEDVYSRIFFSYRTGFEPLKHTKPVEIRSDTGWGCTIRTGQMLIAEGLLRHSVDRVCDFGKLTDQEKATVDKLTKLFYDELAPESPFSIHALTNAAFSQFGKKPGEWYNPSMVGHVLNRVMLNVNRNTKRLPELANVITYVAQDSCIFITDLLERCIAGDGVTMSWNAAIILVPIRLGLDRVNPTYFYCIQRFLENPYSIGFVGGRENSSYYFVGYQNNDLIYLDPHFLQDSESRESQCYHTAQAKKMRFKDLKPSCLLGFYCKSKDELRDFLSSVQVDTQAFEHKTRKMFHLVEVCEGSATKYESRATFKMTKSTGSLEILSLFEETEKQATDKV